MAKMIEPGEMMYELPSVASPSLRSTRSGSIRWIA